MAFSNEVKEKIAIQVIKTLYKQFEKFPEDVNSNRNAPFHEAFLSAFADKLESKVASVPIFISLSSWLHGLNTSLGQSFFENVSQIICNGEKREFTTHKKGNLKITQKQKDDISNIITNLTNGISSPSLEHENKIIFDLEKTTEQIDASDFTVDVFYENDKEIICLELKTVKPNKGTFKGEKEKILEAKASLKLRCYQNKEIKYYLAFPFDPQSNIPCGSDKDSFMEACIGFTKYFDKEEILLANEFWDFLSGDEQTMEEILSIINRIATPKFEHEFEFLSNSVNREKQEYLELLEKWYLFREKLLLENINLIKKQPNKLQNLFNQSCFKDGEYKLSRIQELLDKIKSSPV